jgi:hypothetical protein
MTPRHIPAWYRAGRQKARRSDQQLLIAEPASRNAPFAIAILRSKVAPADGGEVFMRSLMVGAVVLALAAAPAYAQMGKRGRGDDKKTEEKKPKVDEKAYQEALKRIPEPKEKYDPWSGARPSDKKPAK